MSHAAQGPASVQLCAFRVGEGHFVLDIMRIREIVRPMPLTSMPAMPDCIDGFINLRGMTLPVINVGRALSFAKDNTTPALSRRSRILICAIDRDLIGLKVDVVTDVLRLPLNTIEPTPSMAWTDATPSMAAAPVIAGIIHHKDTAYLLLNVRALLAHAGHHAGVTDQSLQASLPLPGGVR